MSYTIEITKGPLPDDDDEAWEYLEDLRDANDLELEEEGRAPGEHFLPLYEQLTRRYPCILEDPDSIWSDGPLIGNFGKELATLGIKGSTREDPFPFIIQTANDLGFTVFDAQDERIHRPTNWKPATPAWAAPPQVPRRRLRMTRELWLWLALFAAAGLAMLLQQLRVLP